MTIQIPNPGTGNGQTGDNEFVLWSKVKGNFEDVANAANRLVGTSRNNVPAYEPYGLSNFGYGGLCKNIDDHDLNVVKETGFYVGRRLLNSPDAVTAASLCFVWFMKYSDAHCFQLLSDVRLTTPTPWVRCISGNVTGPWIKLKSTENTTTDSNGFVKAASPVIQVYADKIGLNDDAKNQDVTFTKNGTGDYTITTISGLSTDGWYLELPKDLNGNPKIAVTLEETNGVISLKSYKRIFSMETFTFVPDLDTPMDIPDDRWIDLRLNDFPVDEPLELSNEV